MDSKAMADSFLEALQNGGGQPAAQDSSAAGLSHAQIWGAQAVVPWSPAVSYAGIMQLGLLCILGSLSEGWLRWSLLNLCPSHLIVSMSA